MKCFPILLVATILLLGKFSMAQDTSANVPDKAYLFVSFRGNGDGLHIAWSSDAMKWTALNGDRPYMTPTVGGKLMRDPCLIRAADGTFHMVWTSGWWDKSIGYSSSKDLIHWSEQKLIPVMEHEPTAKNSWAPEITYDSAKQNYVIFWSTTIPGRFPAGEENGDKAADGTMLNHRIYFTTTKDFQTFSPAAVLFDPGYSVIDATMVRVDGKTAMIYKDETLKPEPKKNLHVAWAAGPAGPFTDISPAFTANWVEGPAVMKAGDKYICYFDKYRDHKYGAMTSTDLKTWQDVSNDLALPNGTRHGTAIAVDGELIRSLMNAQSTTQASAR